MQYPLQAPTQFPMQLSMQYPLQAPTQYPMLSTLQFSITDATLQYPSQAPLPIYTGMRRAGWEPQSPRFGSGGGSLPPPGPADPPGLPLAVPAVRWPCRRAALAGPAGMSFMQTSPTLAAPAPTPTLFGTAL